MTEEQEDQMLQEMRGRVMEVIGSIDLDSPEQMAAAVTVLGESLGMAIGFSCRGDKKITRLALNDVIPMVRKHAKAAGSHIVEMNKAAS